MKDDKYIVFKRSDWDGENTNRLVPVVDAVVIRRQDIFAAPAFDAYANCIIAAIEVIKHNNGKDTTRLQEIADFFHAQASLAWQVNRKLPD